MECVLKLFHYLKNSVFYKKYSPKTGEMQQNQWTADQDIAIKFVIRQNFPIIWFGGAKIRLMNGRTLIDRIII